MLAFISENLSWNTCLNLMDQYHPCYRADECPPLDHPLTGAEFCTALEAAKAHGLGRLDRPGLLAR